MRAFLREHGLALFFLGVFLASLLGQSVAGQRAYNEEEAAHGGTPVSCTRYVTSSDFGQAVMENWQSEFLAVGTMAVFTIYLRARGSPESKPVGSPHRETSSN